MPATTNLASGLTQLLVAVRSWDSLGPQSATTLHLMIIFWRATLAVLASPAEPALPISARKTQGPKFDPAAAKHLELPG